MLAIQMGNSSNIGVMSCLVHEGLQSLSSCGFFMFFFKCPEPSYFVIKFSDIFPTSQQDYFFGSSTT